MGPIDESWAALHRGYRALAARAKLDPAASIQFKESHLWVTADPSEAMAIVREHPLIKPGLEGSGNNEGVQFRTLNTSHLSDLKSLVSYLAKLSVKEGGEEAARRLHCYLTAGANGTLPAYEITVLHGLVVRTRFNLGMGAYLAPYGKPERSSTCPKNPSRGRRRASQTRPYSCAASNTDPASRRPAMMPTYPMCKSPTASPPTTSATFRAGSTTASC